MRPLLSSRLFGLAGVFEVHRAAGVTLSASEVRALQAALLEIAEALRAREEAPARPRGCDVESAA